MAFLRRSGASQRVRRKSSFYTSVGIGALLLLAVGVVWCFEDGERSISQERRLDGYWDDPLIDQPYGKADNRGLVFVHIIIILYMLLGLNTVCDVYFSGSLEVMVEQWNVKPDVAGATFMAAGGSAPELFTSLIGAWLENDVGFSTIVGSAVFNVLFVIGICGFVSSDPIQLTWWPLFRDCTFYTIGLSLLAGFASDESIEFWEALVLFIAYLIYCTLMYHNTKLEAFTDVEFMRAKRVLPDDSMAWAAPGATTRPEQIPQPAPPSTPAPALQVPPESPPEDDADGQHGIGGGPSVSSLKSTGQLSSQPSTPARMGRRHSSRVPSHVHGKMKAAYIAGQGLAERHEDRMHSIGPDVAMAARRSERDLLRRASEPDRQEVSANEPSPKRNSFRYMSNPSSYISSKVTNFSPEEDPLNKKHSHTLSLNKEVKEMKLGKELSDEKEKELGLAETVPQGEGEEAQEEEEEDDANLLQRPEGRKDMIIFYLSLPVYIPLAYGIPRPSKKWFLATFLISLLWIAGFSFLLVYCVEILGQVLGISYLILGFTVLAAGTSIPDAVSSMAVARLGEGDMAVSSSVGSNIFDILVGLPIPWMLKIGIVEGGNYSVNIKSPFLVFDVILLLFMVVCVVVSIHLLKWTLNRSLGLTMAALYIFFLVVVITVEGNPDSFQWLVIKQ